MTSYSDTLKEYGPDDPRSVKWGTKQTQYFRFKILCEIGDLTDASIVDYGCGLGDLYDYLLTQGFKGNYIGVDENQDLIEAATKKYPVYFAVGHNIPSCDYVLLSGVFNEPVENREQLIRTTIKAAFESAKKGVGINFIYTPTEGMAHSDPLDLFTFANTLSPFVTLRQDYRQGNFTLFIYKNKGVDF